MAKMGGLEKDDRNEKSLTAKTETLAEMSFSTESREKNEESAPKRTRKKAAKEETESVKDAGEKKVAPRTRKKAATESTEDKKSRTRTKKGTQDEVEVKEKIVTVDSVTVGNYKNHGRGKFWYDVVVRASDGSVLNFSFVNDTYGGCITSGNQRIPNNAKPFELSHPKEKQLSELPELLTRAIFRSFHPKGTEEEYCKFTYGEELGAKVYQDYEWANENPISQERDVTLEIRDAIGSISDIQLDKVVGVRRDKKHLGATQRDLFYTITDDSGTRWRVVVQEDSYAGYPYDNYKIERESEYLERKRRKEERNSKKSSRSDEVPGKEKFSMGSEWDDRWGRDIESMSDQNDIDPTL